jgi:hypothetical protein
MSCKYELLHRYEINAQSSEEPAALDYMAMRNLDALRAWRAKYLAFTFRAGPRPAVSPRLVATHRL